jgi:hypothetical protein
MNDLTADEWEAWQLLTPQERWRESMKLWEIYLAAGGSLEPEYDPQSPFNNDYYPDGPPADEPQYVYVDHSDNHDATPEEIDRDFALLAGFAHLFARRFKLDRMT